VAPEIHGAKTGWPSQAAERGRNFKVDCLQEGKENTEGTDGKE
jgi:hypothetical protein